MIDDVLIFQILSEAVCPFCGETPKIERPMEGQIFSFKSPNHQKEGCAKFNAQLNEKFGLALSGHLPLAQLRQWVEGLKPKQ